MSSFIHFLQLFPPLCFSFSCTTLEFCCIHSSLDHERPALPVLSEHHRRTDLPNQVLEMKLGSRIHQNPPARLLIWSKSFSALSLRRQYRASLQRSTTRGSISLSFTSFSTEQCHTKQILTFYFGSSKIHGQRSNWLNSVALHHREGADLMNIVKGSIGICDRVA